MNEKVLSNKQMFDNFKEMFDFFLAKFDRLEEKFDKHNEKLNEHLQEEEGLNATHGTKLNLVLWLLGTMFVAVVGFAANYILQ